LLLEDEPEHACWRKPGCQRGDLLQLARLPQLIQQVDHAARVVVGDVGGRIMAQQCGDLLVRALLPQPVQQADYAAGVVEGGVGGGPGRAAGVTAESGRRIAEAGSARRFAGCGDVLAELGGGTVQAARVVGRRFSSSESIASGQ
jgi:hypothetical protein